MLIVRINYSMLCACALSIPHPITFGKKNRSFKVYENTFLTYLGLKGAEVDY